MDAQIRELALGIWFGCKTSGFLREAAGQLGSWAAERPSSRAAERVAEL